MSAILSFPEPQDESEDTFQDFEGEAPLDWMATTARPGTPDKVAVMAERVERRMQLFHPRDGILPDDEFRVGTMRSHGQAKIHGALSEIGANGERRAFRKVKARTSQFPGVHKHASGLWKAVLSLGGKQHYLGLFKTEREAYEVYLEAKEQRKAG